MSALVPAAKVEAIRALGAEVRIVGRSQDEAAVESRRLAADEGLAEIPPFDDAHVIAGQGTAGLELVEDRPDLATVLVPLSGGGLAAGVALAVKAANPPPGSSASPWTAAPPCTPPSPPAARSRSRRSRASPTRSAAASATTNRLTFALCRALLDDILLVTEAEIYRAMQALYWHDRLVTEGAAAVAAAAILSGRFTPAGPDRAPRHRPQRRHGHLHPRRHRPARHPRRPHPRRPPPCPMTSSSSPRPSSAAPCPSTSPPIDIIERAFAALHAGGVVMPPVLSMALPAVNGEVDVKTACIPGFDGFAIKVSPGFFDNPKLASRPSTA